MLSHNYILLTLYATLFTWLLTTLGSSMVFFFKKIKKTYMDVSLSTAAGIMLSASFFSLLNPAIDNAITLFTGDTIMTPTEFLLGSLFILLTDKISNNKSSLLMLSITMHNIPEGLAIGIAFGSIKYGINGATLTNALLLSAIVEPIFGVIGVLLTIIISCLMPLFLSFAAGAMIYVVIKELIPESQKNNHKSLMTLSTIIGFIIMMILDILM